METKRLNKINENLDIELQFTLEKGLKAFKIEIEKEDELLTLIHSQPYKPNIDGTRCSWENAEDAFVWFEKFSKEMFQ